MIITLPILPEIPYALHQLAPFSPSGAISPKTVDDDRQSMHSPTS
ncbi:hypothetical protein A2U01_0049379 [Trifolium medium]|uniref:Uncharacterized protein n=1 Tax=Trifolium medium TaxID=97028 RepID=A0A392QVZ4_9FABA|nr:hypothetical protein [Trifolium medium]